MSESEDVSLEPNKIDNVDAEPNLNDDKKDNLAYSYDILKFSFDCDGGIIDKIVATALFAPFSFVIRITMAMSTLPRQCYRRFLSNLFCIAIMVTAVGLFVFIKTGNLMIAIAGVVSIIFSSLVQTILDKKSPNKESKKTPVEIDTDVISGMCEDIYSKLDKIKGDNNHGNN